MFNLNEEELKKAAARMREASRGVQERLIKDAPFGEKPLNSPFSVSTPTAVGWHSILLWAVITSPYVVEKKRRSREAKRTFWQKLWVSLTDLNPWPYSPIEFYEVEVPAITIDRRNNQIICHPSLEQEIKKEMGI